MGSLKSLFNAASGVEEVKVSSCNEEECNITEETSVDGILDWLMLYICRHMDVEEAAFKGGYVLSRIIPKNEARGTRDIDFSILRKEYYDVVKKVLSSAGDILMGVGVVLRYELKDNVEPTMSGGITFVMSDGTRHLGVDVGLHDITYGTHKIEVNGNLVSAFTPERMLADKFSAMFTRKRFRRVKDLYDFYVITNNFDVNISSLSDMISKRGELDYGLSPVRDEIMDGYRHAYDTLNLNVNADANRDLVEKPSFDTVIHRLRIFVSRLEVGGIWDHVSKEML